MSKATYTTLELIKTYKNETDSVSIFKIQNDGTSRTFFKAINNATGNSIAKVYFARLYDAASKARSFLKFSY